MIIIMILIRMDNFHNGEKKKNIISNDDNGNSNN